MTTPNYIAYYDQYIRYQQTLQAAANLIFSNNGTVAPNPIDSAITTCCPISVDIYQNFNNIYQALDALREMMLEISSKIPCGPSGGCILSASFNKLSSNVEDLSARLVWPDVDYTDGGSAEDSGGPDTGFVSN